MPMMPVAFKLIGGACVVALFFWITLQLLEYRRSTLTTSPATESMGPEDRPSRGSAQTGRAIQLFDQRSSRVEDLAVTWNAAEGPEGSRAALLLEDRSNNYGRIFQEIAIANDDRTHTVSIDVKPATSPLGALHMTYLGGQRPKTYYAFLHLNNPSEDMLPSGEGRISSKYLGNNWFRITLSGANNASGNTKLLVQFYPRHGAPQDTGSCYMANPILE